MSTRETTKTEEQLRSEQDRRDFQGVWLGDLKPKSDALARMPAAAMAYEIAWHAFRAGRGRKVAT